MLFRGEKDQTILITIWCFFFFKSTLFHDGIKLKGQTCINHFTHTLFPCVIFTYKKTIKPINKFLFCSDLKFNFSTCVYFGTNKGFFFFDFSQRCTFFNIQNIPF